MTRSCAKETCKLKGWSVLVDGKRDTGKCVMCETVAEGCWRWIKLHSWGDLEMDMSCIA